MSENLETTDIDVPTSNKSWVNWRVTVLIVFILVPLVNFGVPIFSVDGERFADDPQTRVAAAGYAFAIWGVIFTGMICFSAFMLASREPDSPHLRRALICLSIAGLASILFVPISIYGDQVLGWLDIMLHLIPLIIANRALRQHAQSHKSSHAGRWSYIGPSMYFGWISAATVISTALMANQLGIELGDSTATTVSLAVILLLGAAGLLLTINRDPVYGATVAWALAAVGVEQAAYPSIRYTSWVVAAVVACAVAYQLTRSVRFFAVAPDELDSNTNQDFAAGRA